MKFYWLRPVKPRRSTGDLNDNHKWGLPGLLCPFCGATWAASESYPCVDLSGLAERATFEKAWREEDFEEFQRLRELVRPLAPKGVPLGPGTTFGPFVGKARGTFGPLYMPFGWTLLVLSDALVRLQAEGLHGLKGCRTELQFKRKPPSEVLEMQMEPHGYLHPDCIPFGTAKPCAHCGLHDFDWPDEPILDAASLPPHLDLFRLARSPRPRNWPRTPSKSTTSSLRHSRSGLSVVASTRFTSTPCRCRSRSIGGSTGGGTVAHGMRHGASG